MLLSFSSGIPSGTGVLANSPAGPADFHGGDVGARAEHDDGIVRRPPAGAEVQFPGRAPVVAVAQADDGADAPRVAGTGVQAQAEAGARDLVPVEPGGGAVLAHDQVHAAVPVEIGQRRAAAFAVDFDAGPLAAHGVRFPRPSPRNHRPRPASIRGHSGRTARKFWLRKRSSAPSPSASATARPNTGANPVGSGAGGGVLQEEGRRRGANWEGHDGEGDG